MESKINRQKMVILLIVLTMIFSSIMINPVIGKADLNSENDNIVYHGLKGDYYKSTSTSTYDFAQYVSTFLDEEINFYPSFTNLLRDRTGQTEACAVRWTGKIQPKYSEDYTFYMIGDNGFRLWIDNKLIIDHWVNDWEIQQNSLPITLEAGKLYNIKIEYFQATGGADLKLEWSSKSQPRQVIPVDCLYQPDGSNIPVVTSAEQITVNTEQYSKPNLPNVVTVNYNDGTHKQLPVTWDLGSGDKFDNIGEVIVYGSIYGSTVKATAKVIVSPYKGWKMQQAPLMTQWANQVGPDNALPEYPRMQMQRAEWMNLNGLWQFQPGKANDEVPIGQNLSRFILVPYPMESALSGVMNHYDYSWYRKVFTIPDDWKGKRVILNFGAVDYESEIFINGKSVGSHKGGYDSFSYDITPYLNSSGEQEVIVKVFDDTSHDKGKQSPNPGGIFYTPTSGIWQTVWLEPVSDISIKDIKMVPDIDNSQLKLSVNTTDNTSSGLSIDAVVKDTGTQVVNISGDVGKELNISIPNEKLWSPQNPFLYDIDITLKKDGNVIDHITSYFGMRKISVETVNGIKKIFLNNKFTFLIGPLDQGFWPDGIYTAPTDDALKWDIEQEKNLGFNAVRKHIKVEPDRWYYWADKLGILVLQDKPSGNGSAGDESQFINELHRMIETHWNHPSIIDWIVFNEGWGQYNDDTVSITNTVNQLDPSRLVTCASGWNDYDVGDIQDMHHYPDPAIPNSNTRARVDGEYGGIQYAIKDHLWDSNYWGGYTGDAGNPDDYSNMYYKYCQDIDNLKNQQGLSGAIYTQITDLEQELNGLFTYDRKVFKGNDKIKEGNLLASKVISSVQPIQVITKPGVAPILPNHIKATYTDGSQYDVTVAWDSIDPTEYESEGTFKVEGTIEGSNIKAVANITVTSEVIIGSLSSVTIEANKTTINTSEKERLNYFGTLDNGSIIDLSNAKVEFSSDNPNVAAVNNNGEVTGKSIGTATISVMVTLNDITKTDNIKITVIGAPTIPNNAYIENFNSQNLDKSWQIIHPDLSRVTLAENPGFLRIKTLTGDMYRNENTEKNVLLHDVQQGDFEIITKVTAPVREDTQQGGLVIWQDDNNYIRFGSVWLTGAGGYCLESAKEIDGNYTSNIITNPNKDTLYLKIKKVGDQFTTYYWNGLSWIKASDPITASLNNYKVGIYGISGASRNSINIDFDYFAIVNQEPNGISVNPTKMALNIGDTKQVTATVYDQNNNPISGINVNWTSDNPDVATVDNAGKITGVSAGTTTVKATYGDLSASVNVTVKGETNNTEATLEGQNSIKIGNTYTLTYGLKNAKDISAQVITLKYDPNIFDYVKADSIIDGTTITATYENQPGTITFVLATTDKGKAINGDKEVLNITLKAKTLAQGTKITLTKGEISNTEGNIMDLKPIEKTINVVAEIDKTYLEKAIKEAKEFDAAIKEGINNGQYPEGTKSQLEEAIKEAQSVYDNKNVDQTTIDKATDALNNTVKEIKGWVITDTTGIVKEGETEISIGDLGIVATYFAATSNSEDWNKIKNADINHNNKIDLYDITFIARRIIMNMFKK